MKRYWCRQFATTCRLVCSASLWRCGSWRIRMPNRIRRAKKIKIWFILSSFKKNNDGKSSQTWISYIDSEIGRGTWFEHRNRYRRWKVTLDTQRADDEETFENSVRRMTLTMQRFSWHIRRKRVLVLLQVYSVQNSNCKSNGASNMIQQIGPRFYKHLNQYPKCHSLSYAYSISLQHKL